MTRWVQTKRGKVNHLLVTYGYAGHEQSNTLCGLRRFEWKHPQPGAAPCAYCAAARGRHTEPPP